MNTDDLYRKTCRAITDRDVSDKDVAKLMEELEATGDEAAIAAAMQTMEWRDPGHMAAAKKQTPPDQP
jgi:hypothetical protein